MEGIEAPQAQSGRTSVFYGAFLGVLFLPGFGLLYAVPLGMLGMLGLRFIKPGAARTWIVEHRALVALGGFVVGACVWPNGGNVFVHGFRGALAAYVLASVLGASGVGAPQRNVGILLGLLIGGAFGGPIRAVLGCAVGGFVGMLMRNRSGVSTGLAVTCTLAATMMTPSCKGYGIDITSTTKTAGEQASEYMTQQWDDAERRGVPVSVWDMAGGPGDFEDRKEFSWGGFIVAWFTGLCLSVIFGAVLGELAKARAAVPVATPLATPLTAAEPANVSPPAPG